MHGHLVRPTKEKTLTLEPSKHVFLHFFLVMLVEGIHSRKLRWTLKMMGLGRGISFQLWGFPFNYGDFFQRGVYSLQSLPVRRWVDLPDLMFQVEGDMFF